MNENVDLNSNEKNIIIIVMNKIREFAGIRKLVYLPYTFVV